MLLLNNFERIYFFFNLKIHSDLVNSTDLELVFAFFYLKKILAYQCIDIKRDQVNFLAVL